jgi:hypothetical protein
VGGNERLELWHELAVTAECEVGGDPFLERREVELLKPRRLDGRELRVTEIRERGAFSERERLAERLRSLGGSFFPRLFDQRSEAPHVELTCVDTKQIATALGDDSDGAKQLPQRMHRDLESVCSRLRWGLAPDCVDQPVARNDGIRVQEQDRQQGPLTPPADGEDAAILLDLEWTEQPEFEPFAASLLHPSRLP